MIVKADILSNMKYNFVYRHIISNTIVYFLLVSYNLTNFSEYHCLLRLGESKTSFVFFILELVLLSNSLLELF